MSSSDGLGAGLYGDYDYEFDGYLHSAENSYVWSDDSNDEDGYLHSYPVDVSDDENDNSILQGLFKAEEPEEWFSNSLAIPRPVCTTSPTVDNSDDENDGAILQGPKAEELEEWSSISLAIPRPVSPTYLTVDDSSDDYLPSEPKHPSVPEAPASADVPVSASAGVASAHPPASIYLATSPKRTVTASPKGESPAPVPAVRGRSAGSSDFCGTTITIVPVGPSPVINTFGSSGLVRGRLRSLQR